MNIYIHINVYVHKNMYIQVKLTYIEIHRYTHLRYKHASIHTRVQTYIHA